MHFNCKFLLKERLVLFRLEILSKVSKEFPDRVCWLQRVYYRRLYIILRILFVSGTGQRG